MKGSWPSPGTASRWSRGWIRTRGALEAVSDRLGTFRLVPDSPRCTRLRETDALALRAPHPNPSRGDITISFAVGEPGRVRATVLDVQGRIVRVLADGRRERGERSLVWDGRAGGRRTVVAGLYFVRVTAGDESRTRRIPLAR